MNCTAREAIIAIAIEENFDWNKIYDHIKSRKEPDTSLLNGIDTKQYITIVDEDYPEGMKNARSPLFLFLRNSEKLVRYHSKWLPLNNVMEDLKRRLANLDHNKEEDMDEINTIWDMISEYKDGAYETSYEM